MDVPGIEKPKIRRVDFKMKSKLTFVKKYLSLN